MTPPRSAFQGGDQGPLLERLWNSLTSPEVHEQLRSGKITRANLDENVQFRTGGKLKSFADLANARTRAQGISSQQEQAAIQKPSRALTYASEAANAMALGLPEKTKPYAQPGSPMEGFNEILQRGREEYPRTAPLASMAGMLPATALGGLAEGAAEPAIGWLSKIPGLGSSLAKMLMRGAVGAAGAGAASEYAQSPELAPDWKRIGTAAATSAPFGAGGAVPAWWAATKLNPMEHMASRAVMESAPGTEPSMAAGTSALREGTTSPMPIGRPGPEETMFKTLSQAENEALPEPLQQMNFEKSAKLRADAAKFLANSPEASNMARVALTEKIGRIRQTLSGMEQAYEPMLKARPLVDADIAQLPQASQSAMNALQKPTARDLFKRYKSLRDKSASVFDANESGTLADASKLDDAAAMKEEAHQLREWLGNNVTQFNELQHVTGKWLQRLDEVKIARRQIVGRAIKPLGKTTDVPAGEAGEGVRELTGYNKRLITDRAARRLAPVLLSPKLEDLLHAAKHPELKEIIPDLIRSLPAVAGAAVPSARDLIEPKKP